MLIWNWRAVLTKAWSVRFIVAAGVFSGAEVAVPFFLKGMEPGLLAAVGALLSAAALVARLWAQRNLEK